MKRMREMPDYRMKWIRIWPHAWFDSSMRVELTNEERAFWVDMLARAGKSRIPGVICSDPEGKVGYPLAMLTSQLVSWTQEQVVTILEKLAKTDRVQVIHSPLFSGDEGWIVSIVNWEKYQSEAQRVQKYRNTARSEKRNRPDNTPNQRTTGRIEEEEEVEVDKKKNKKEHIPDWLPLEPWQGFVEMRKKIGHPLTDRAKELAIRNLEKLKADGNDPEAVLDQSTFKGWRGLFEVKPNSQTGDTSHLE